ncbi:MAG: 1-deoxy-D-xylulose-5-phosphate synthase, partial [Clostridiales bacterium]|nr:1-deoxy-D-xylulose-5-phosphate synthase [Clostridiales bacterium]
KEVYHRVIHAIPGGRFLYKFNHKIKVAIKTALLPCSMFEDMGFAYMGPVDGHDVAGLTRLLRYAKGIKGPALLHVRTTKGKGYLPSTRNPDTYHGVSPFDKETGVALKASGTSFSQVFGDALCRMAREDERICAITAAMQDGTGLDGFSRQFPARFFDVGIAEGHAVSMAAGMAKQGMVPVFAVYSSFLQRGYDMLLHDVAIQGLHVVFGVDRAGLVGEDGETHHGIFDAAYLYTVPGMTVFSPASFAELETMLREAVYHVDGPVAVRYPRGGEGDYRGDAGAVPAACLRQGRDITLVGYGTLINNILDAADRLAAAGLSPEVIKLGTILPIDWDTLKTSLEKTRRLLVAEDCVAMGSVGERIAAWICRTRLELDSVVLHNCGDGFITHGTVHQLCKTRELDAESLFKKAMEVCGHG